MIYMLFLHFFFFFFFNDTATTEIYTLSLHDALPIYSRIGDEENMLVGRAFKCDPAQLAHGAARAVASCRSEEHTSELQSRLHLVCRLLLEKKNKKEENAERNS